MADLDAYYDGIQPRLHATHEARRALRMSFTPLPPSLLPLRLVVPPLNTLAFASLPRWARRMYGTPGSALTDLAATAALRTARQSTARLPRNVLRLPLGRITAARMRSAA